MALTKAKLFKDEQVQIAAFAKALAHPARVAILEILIRQNACYCGDITEELPLAQSTISQHLKALRASGIIKGEIEGVKTCYCIDEEKFAEFRQVIEGLLGKIKSRSTVCC